MADERSTIVGESIVIKGEISGDQDLILHGRVEGEIHLTKDLYIKPPSETNANINAQTVTVSGRVEGNVDATEKVELSAEGRMIGDIKAPRIVIVDGAYFKGTIDMGEEGERPAPKAQNQSSEESPKAEKKAEGKKTEPAQEGEQGEGNSKDRKMVMPDYLLGKKK